MEENERNEKSTENGKAGCAISIVVFLAILGAILAVVFVMAKRNPTGEGISSITKSQPTLTIDNTMSGVKVNVYAVDNYTEVCVKIKCYDNNGSIVKEENLIGSNYRKGNTYALVYTFSLSEVLSVKTVGCELVYYK